MGAVHSPHFPRVGVFLEVTTLELRFLGDLAVLRGGEALALPPSKKTRALLAYLALHDRAFRREHLCELLWEIPDDPRGSLRWSLSKLRRLVDDDKRRRVVADRVSVRLDVSDIPVDVIALKALVSGELAQAEVAALEDAADRYRGNFLEGLELSNFHDFHSWCVSERAVVNRAQTALLETLLARLSDDPERALPRARALVGLTPYDESARASLIRLLVRLNLADEAQQQYELGRRMLEETGVESTGVLFRAWRGAPAGRSAGRAQVGTPTGSATPPADDVVGRESELEALAGEWKDVCEHGRARVVLLRGEPGIGKSRLLEWMVMLARGNGAHVLEAGAVESEGLRPFGLWIDALRGNADHPNGPVFSAEGLENRERLLATLSDQITRFSDPTPVVLAFDDVQWCDESSAAALHYVTRTNRRRPLLAVLAAREDELRDNGPVQQTLRGLRRENLLTEMKLGPLGEKAIRALVEARAPEVDSRAIGRESGGNPLLAIELARADAAGDEGGSLDELVRERLARFDVEGSEVLHWAAVLSPRIDVATLVRVTDLGANRVGEVFEVAERQALLRQTPRGFRFSHDLIAQAVYRDISPARRAVMHRRAAELLERDTATDLAYAADLAHHALLSGDPGLAARAMVSAGRLCLRFFANDDALALAGKGLQLAGQLESAERICLRLDLFDIMLSAAPVLDWETAAAEYVALAEEALDHGALAHARLGYHMASNLRWMHGHWAGAREETLQAERVTRSGSEEDHIIGMAETAKCLAMLERDLSQADAMLMEARALARRRRFSYYAIPSALGMLRFHEGRFDEAEELLLEARAHCKSSGDRLNEYQANEYLVMIELERNRLDAARERCAALIDLGEKLREGSEAPFARALKGLCELASEDSSDAVDQAIEELRVVDAKHRLAYTLIRAALIDLQRGRFDLAMSRGSEALDYAEALDRPTEKLLAHVVLARACEGVGDGAGCAQHQAAVRALDDGTVAQWARQEVATMNDHE